MLERKVHGSCKGGEKETPVRNVVKTTMVKDHQRDLRRVRNPWPDHWKEFHEMIHGIERTTLEVTISLTMTFTRSLFRSASLRP